MAMAINANIILAVIDVTSLYALAGRKETAAFGGFWDHLGQ